MGAELEKKFRQIKQTGSAYVRVSANHPVDLFVGIDDGRRSMLLLCESEPKGLPFIDAVEVRKRLRDDGRWALLVALMRSDLGAMFAYLCTDLVEATLEAESGDSAAAALIERLKWWQRLLSKGRSSVLAEPALRGLVSELLFLADHAIPELGPDPAVNGWVGPYEAPRDFKFDALDVEVKSIRRDGTEIKVTSLEQLDQSGANVPLSIAVVALERVQEAQQGAFSCAELVRRVKSLCEPGDDAIQGVTERLWLAGYTDLEEYESIWFLGRPFAFYACLPAFPRILRKDVSNAIVSCTYDINLASIDQFRVPTWRTPS